MTELWQTNALKVDQFVWWVEPMRGRGEWKCVWEATGAPCAVMDGQRKMHWWSADKLDMTHSVRLTNLNYNLIVVCSLIFLYFQGLYP